MRQWSLLQFQCEQIKSRRSEEQKKKQNEMMCKRRKNERKLYGQLWMAIFFCYLVLSRLLLMLKWIRWSAQEIVRILWKFKLNEVKCPAFSCGCWCWLKSVGQWCSRCWQKTKTKSENIKKTCEKIWITSVAIEMDYIFFFCFLFVEKANGKSLFVPVNNQIDFNNNYGCGWWANRTIDQRKSQIQNKE